MIQTDSGKYAVRAITYIAHRDEPELPVSAAEVAEAEGIPPYYLAKVLQDLARAGVLASMRGRGGGFHMKRPPDDIPVMEVLRAVEDVKRLTEDCVLGLDACSDEVSCPMHGLWKTFRELMVSRLEQMTVDDLVQERMRKRKYLAPKRRARS